MRPFESVFKMKFSILNLSTFDYNAHAFLLDNIDLKWGGEQGLVSVKQLLLLLVVLYLGQDLLSPN